MQPSPTRSSGDLLADRRYDYATFAKAEGDFEAAADLLRQVIEIVPRWAPAWFTLGEVEAARGDTAAAVAAFTQALACDPGDALGARLHLVRLGEAQPEALAMTPAYVATLFDQFAPRFETALRRGLSYCGPELLQAAIRQVAPARRFSRLLDLGCGTGLAADIFRGDVAAMDGVDLSPRMVEIARRKGLYRRLAVGDIGAALAAEPAAGADLILAADVFVYCAAIGPILMEVARVLQPAGLVGFTVETHDGHDVRLGAGLRYAHGEATVREALDAAGLRLLSLDHAPARHEAGVPAPGLVVVAEA